MKDRIIKTILILIGVLFTFLMLILPLAIVLFYALREGVVMFFSAITEPFAVAALNLTLLSTGITLVVNTVFGMFAAWTITKYRFRGKQVLTALIDIPFSISTVIAGLAFIAVFGRIGWANPITEALNIRIVFAVPGVVLTAIFVTFPFVSRELIPMMQAQGNEEEEAAALMGAKGFYIFRKITLPKMKWGLLYGVILTTARAMGEFGAAAVVSGRLRGRTNTLPLHIEMLFNEFQLTAAFAVSSILVMISVIILILRHVVEHRMKQEEG
ncbi:MAG: sulfate ABC transporter permease subunit CysW [Defluviitaleaceae bacterium]|nr:sulfate ABC transporter permease subunit CysW [Defluviitaleaceae bacterium]